MNVETDLKVGDIVTAWHFAEEHVEHEVVEIKEDEIVCCRVHDGEVQWLPTQTSKRVTLIRRG